MDTRDHLLLQLSLLVETTSPQVVLTLLSWFGKVTSMKMIKNSLKTLVLNKVTTSKLEAFHLSLKEDHQLPRKPLVLLEKQGKMFLPENL